MILVLCVRIYFSILIDVKNNIKKTLKMVKMKTLFTFLNLSPDDF